MKPSSSGLPLNLFIPVRKEDTDLGKNYGIIFCKKSSPISTHLLFMIGFIIFMDLTGLSHS